MTSYKRFFGSRDVEFTWRPLQIQLWTMWALKIKVTWHQKGVAYLLDIANPVLDVVEGLLIGDVIHQHDALMNTRQEMTSAQEVQADSWDQDQLVLTRPHDVVPLFLYEMLRSCEPAQASWLWLFSTNHLALKQIRCTGVLPHYQSLNPTKVDNWVVVSVIMLFLF